MRTCIGVPNPYDLPDGLMPRATGPRPVEPARFAVEFTAVPMPGQDLIDADFDPLPRHILQGIKEAHDEGRVFFNDEEKERAHLETRWDVANWTRYALARWGIMGVGNWRSGRTDAQRQMVEKYPDIPTVELVGMSYLVGMEQTADGHPPSPRVMPWTTPEEVEELELRTARVDAAGASFAVMCHDPKVGVVQGEYLASQPTSVGGMSGQIPKPVPPPIALPDRIHPGLGGNVPKFIAAGVDGALRSPHVLPPEFRGVDGVWAIPAAATLIDWPAVVGVERRLARRELVLNVAGLPAATTRPAHIVRDLLVGTVWQQRERLAAGL